MMAKLSLVSCAVLCATTLAFALPTVHYEKSIDASIGGGDVRMAFGGLGAHAGPAGVLATTGGIAGGSASAFAGASGVEAHADGATIEKEITFGHKTIPQRSEVVSEKTFTEAPKVVAEHTVQGLAQVQRTVIEKTIIPQYVEKTIQVPSYVEKTIRVPTVVEHKVRVPVTPKVVEKTYEENGHAGAHAGGFIEGNVQLQNHPAVYHKQFGIRTNVGTPTANSAGSAVSTSSNGYAGGNSYTNAGNDFQVSTYHKSVNGGLLRNILNIPIATLGAVGNLFSGAGGASGSFSVNKKYHTY